MKTTMALYTPLKTGGEFIDTVTQYCWPSYRRISLAMGGDAQATFRFSADDSTMQHWFSEYLGAHFVESFGTVDVFHGYIHTLYLSTNGITIRTTLDNVYNNIAVQYRTGSASSETLTAFASDTDSIAKYGTRTLIYNLNDTYVSATTADSVRDDLLENMAWPTVTPESIQVGDYGGRSVLSVTVRGYAETLNGKLLKDTSTSLVNASDAITTAVSGADFVSAGEISTNTTQVSSEVDYVPAWQRIKQIAELRGGGVWLAGCYQGRELDYFQADINSIRYYVDLRSRQRGQSIYNEAGDITALPLIKPGYMAFVRDVLIARQQSNPIYRDPRSLFVESVQYSQDGVLLKSLDANGVMQSVAIQLSLS